MKKFMEGYNVCLFCYGQTGSGKTFTMFGPDDAVLALSKGAEYITEKDANNFGLVPRSIITMIEQMNETIKPGENRLQYELKMNMVEIYNEQVNDLLSVPRKDNLKIREDPKEGIFIQDVL